MEAHERLRQARSDAGFPSASEACARFGWSVPTYNSHENGHRGFRSDTAAEYAKAFRVTPEWLMFGRGHQAESHPVRLAEKIDLVPVYNVQASAGGGAVIDHEEVVTSLAFPPGYLRRLTRASPENLSIIGVKGDSMIPTLHDDDIVMLDRSKRDLSFDGLFVLRDNGAGLLVKRIGRASRAGHVMVISDNRALYPEVEREISGFDVVGKVIWAGKKI